MTGPAAPPLPAELDALVRRMRLPYLRKAAPDVLATARAQRWEPAEVLRVLLTEEVAGRDAATRRMRRKTAAFPSGKTFSSWRAGESSIPAATQDALATLEWIGRAENLVIAGPSGTGKSHLIEALAHAAIEKDLRVAWFTLETLTTAIGTRPIWRRKTAFSYRRLGRTAGAVSALPPSVSAIPPPHPACDSHRTGRSVRPPALLRQHRHGYAAGFRRGLPTGTPSRLRSRPAR